MPGTPPPAGTPRGWLRSPGTAADRRPLVRGLTAGELPDGPEGAVRRDAEQVVLQGLQPLLAEDGRPGAHGVRYRGLGGPGTGPAFAGQRDQTGPGVVRVAAALHVTLGYELVDELSRSLPGDVEMLGQLGDRRPGRGEPGEREAVRGAQVAEPAGLHPRRDAVHQGPAHRQEPDCQRLRVMLLHASSLTDLGK